VPAEITLIEMSSPSSILSKQQTNTSSDFAIDATVSQNRQDTNSQTKTCISGPVSTTFLNFQKVALITPIHSIILKTTQSSEEAKPSLCEKDQNAAVPDNIHDAMSKL